MTTGFAVTWRKKPHALPFMIDVDSMELAGEIAILLNFQALTHDIAITALEYEIDPEMKARIWARVNKRMEEYEWKKSAVLA